MGPDICPCIRMDQVERVRRLLLMRVAHRIPVTMAVMGPLPSSGGMSKLVRQNQDGPSSLGCTMWAD